MLGQTDRTGVLADTAVLLVTVTGCPHPRMEQVDEGRGLGFLSVHKDWFLRHWTTRQEVGIRFLLSYNSCVGEQAAGLNKRPPLACLTDGSLSH